jgi:urease accessory protein
MSTPMTHTLFRKVAVALVAAAPLAAFAHSGDPGHLHTPGDAFLAGLAHPFTGLDHLAAMVVLGMWSAMTAKRLWLAPVTFALTLLVGALLGLSGVVVPAIEPMIAASVLVLGLLLATNLQLPAAAGAAIAAVFALFHGAAHGYELAGDNASLAILGMVIATIVLHGAGIAIGLSMKRGSVWFPRAAGSAVALAGLFLFAPLIPVT